MTRTLGNLAGQQTIKNIELDAKGLDASSVVIGDDSVGLGLQALVCDWSGSGASPVEAMRAAHRGRLGKKIFPLVVATIDGQDQVWLVGASSGGHCNTWATFSDGVGPLNIWAKLLTFPGRSLSSGEDAVSISMRSLGLSAR